LFSSGREVDATLLLAVAAAAVVIAVAIASGDLRSLYQNGMAASLVLLQIVPMNSVEAFYEAYAVELRTLNVRIFLDNIEWMIAWTRH
jgi:hypothetical protein